MPPFSRGEGHPPVTPQGGTTPSPGHPSGVPGYPNYVSPVSPAAARQHPPGMTIKAIANLDCEFVENALVSFAPNFGPPLTTCFVPTY